MAGTVRLWNSSTYRLETTLNYGMERVWCTSCRRGTHLIALGYDEGCVVVQMGREEPAMSMDGSGEFGSSDVRFFLRLFVLTGPSPPSLQAKLSGVLATRS